MTDAHLIIPIVAIRCMETYVTH